MHVHGTFERNYDPSVTQPVLTQRLPESGEPRHDLTQPIDANAANLMNNFLGV